MNNLCKQYIKNAKTLFPIIGKTEKEYLKKLELNVQDYCEESSVSSIEELYRDFGSPSEVVNSYFSSVKLDYMLKRISISKKIKAFFVVIATLAFIGVSFFGLYLYQAYNLMQDQMVFFEETSIK